MAATETSVTRTDDDSGDTFATYDKDAGTKVQAVALDPEVQGEMLSWQQSDGTADQTLVIKASPGRLFKVDMILDNTVAAVRYLQVFNRANAPSGGDIPVFRGLCPASAGVGGFVSIDFGPYGRFFSTGIVVAVSTTLGTYTATAGGEAFFQAGYL